MRDTGYGDTVRKEIRGKIGEGRVRRLEAKD